MDTPPYNSFSSVCVSGGFDPVHPGHINLLNAAAAYGPLTVILNSDEWLIRKKGYRVMSWEDRARIVGAIRGVVDVVPVDDSDGTICEALRRIVPNYFAKSGDRTPTSMPTAELQTCQALGIEILYDVCPYLPYSSSHIVGPAQVKEEAVWRKWGSYEVLDEGHYSDPIYPQYKVKRLDIGPGQRISLQKHHNREEHWVVVRGQGEMRVVYKTGSYVHVPREGWHQIINLDKSTPLILIEVQMGQECQEGDIERAEKK